MSAWNRPNLKLVFSFSALQNKPIQSQLKTFIQSEQAAIEEVEEKKLIWEEKSIDITKIIEKRAVISIVVKPDIKKSHIRKYI